MLMTPEQIEADLVEMALASEIWPWCSICVRPVRPTGDDDHQTTEYDSHGRHRLTAAIVYCRIGNRHPGCSDACCFGRDRSGNPLGRWRAQLGLKP